MSTRRRIVFYSCLFLLAAGLLGWQWWTEPRYDGEHLSGWLKRTNDADATIRSETATALGELGRNSDPAWTALKHMALHDANADVRNRAVESLERFCQFTDPRDNAERLNRKRAVVQEMLDACKSDDAAIRARAPNALFAAAGLEYYDRVIRRSTDDTVDHEMRPQAVQALVAALDDKDGTVRKVAARCLVRLNNAPEGARAGIDKELKW